MRRKIIYIGAVLPFLVIIFFWWTGSGALFTAGLDSGLLALGRLYGLLAVYTILWQFLLMSRTSFLEKEFGLDTLSRFHQRNGKITITFILLHPLLIILSYSMMGKINVIDQIADLLFNYDDVLNAFIAVILFCLVVGTSIYIARKHLQYEMWYFVHLATYIATLLAFGHQLEIGGDFLVSQIFTYFWYFLYLFVFGFLFLFRFVMPLWKFYNHRFIIQDVINETKSTVSYVISGKNLKNFHVKGGQFMIFRILKNGLWHEAHPFSLSRLNDGQSIRFTAKKVGDYTHKIPLIEPGTFVLIDGPYGIFTADRAKSKKILFLASSSGITPIRSLIEEMGPRGYEMTLLYQNRHISDVIFQKELEVMVKHFNLKVIYVYSDERSNAYEKGEINEEKIRRHVPDFSARDVYFCGSPAFLKSTIHHLKSLGVEKGKMHYEQFAFHFSK